jgi:multidrug resistance efflux pump
MNKKLRNYREYHLLFLLILLLSTVLPGCSNSAEQNQENDEDEFAPLVQEISASGEVVPVKWASLSFTTFAQDLNVLVGEGDEVSSGDVLVRNNDPRLETTRLQAQAAVERAQYAYDQLLDAPSDAALKSAYSAFINARINLKQQEQFGISQDAIDIAQADFDAARANFDGVFRGASKEEIEAAEYDLKAAELALTQAEDAFNLRAPFDGTIAEIYINSGEAIGALQPVLVIADLSELQIITTDLSEVDVTKLSLGDNANIIFDAISDQTYSGTIIEIADTSSGISSVYYQVTLSMDETPPGLRWGMTAFITFPLE